MMSFLTLLLLPIIHLHGKSVFDGYRLQQSLAAMTKQAENVSKTLMAEWEKNKPGKDDKKESLTKKKESDDDETKMLRDELSLSRARLEKANKKQKDLQSELEQTKEKLAQFDTLDKVAKKKT